MTNRRSDFPLGSLKQVNDTPCPFQRKILQPAVGIVATESGIAVAVGARLVRIYFCVSLRSGLSRSNRTGELSWTRQSEQNWSRRSSSDGSKNRLKVRTIIATRSTAAIATQGLAE